MSVAVALQELWERVDEFGPHPFLITTDGDGHAHVASVRARVDGDRIVVGAGRTSRANVTGNPAASLLWSALPGGAYALIVDGRGSVPGDAEEVVVQPERAVLHRVAGAEDVPACVEVLPRA